MLSTVKSKSNQNTSKKSLNSLKVPKKATNESTLEVVEICSNDFVEEIDAHLQDSYRFRKFANEVVKIDGAWLIHNRSLDEAFGRARKRMQTGDCISQSKLVNVSSHYGFLFTKHWSVVESVASNGLKIGNVQNTRLGKSNSGVVINQCADIGLAHLTYSQSKDDESYYDESVSDADSKLDPEGDPIYFMIFVRWLKSKVYVMQSTSALDSVDSDLDPQPGYTCHMTKWSRMDPLDPTKVTLDEVFRNSQVYLYEYDEEMDLKVILDHVHPFAVIKCQWKLSPEVVSGFCTINDGLILLPHQLKDKGSSRKALLSTPPTSLKIAANERAVKPDTVSKGRHVAALLQPPKAPLTAVATIMETETTALANPDGSILKPRFLSKYPSQSRGNSQSLPFNPNPIITCARTLQTALDRRPVDFKIRSSNSPPFNVVNTCFLVWPMSPQLGNSNGAAIESWQFPVDVLSFYGPTSGVFEGLLFPRLVISDLISFTQLHHELAGIKEPSSSSPEHLPSDIIGSSSSQHVRDPRRPKEHSNLSTCSPFVHIDRLREWTVPSKENVENDSCRKPGQFAGYKGNYFLLTLPETSKQQEGVAKLFETLKTRKLACLIKMPCKDNAAFYIFPDSEFSNSIGIPPLSSSESTSFHGILLLPHSLFPTQLENCTCHHVYSSGTNLNCRRSTGEPNSSCIKYQLEQFPLLPRCPASPRETNWKCSTVQYVMGLPNQGKIYHQKVVEYGSDPRSDIRLREPIDVDDSPVFTQTSTPMSPQEPAPYDDAPSVVPIPDAPVLGVVVNPSQSPSASCDMELETSIDSTVPLSPAKSNNDLSTFNGCDAPVPEIPIVPEKNSSVSPSMHLDLGPTQVIHDPNDSKGPEFTQIYFPSALSSSDQYLSPDLLCSDCNSWIKQKVRHHEPSTSTIVPSNPALVAPNPCTLSQVLISNAFSTSSPSDDQVTHTRRFMSHNHSPEEEEGEIVDDDEGGEVQDESDSSSEKNHSSCKPRPRHNSRDRHRNRSTRASSPPYRKRSRHDSPPRRRSPIKRRDKHLTDMDYRTISHSETNHGRSLTSSKYSHTKPKDTDYRYQVYIPKSEQKLSVPVRVIDYGNDSAESEVPQSHARHLTRSYGRHGSSRTQSTTSVPRQLHSRSLNSPNVYPNTSRNVMASDFPTSACQARPLLGYVPTTVHPSSYPSLKFSMEPNRTRLPPRLVRGNSGIESRFQLNNGSGM